MNEERRESVYDKWNIYVVILNRNYEMFVMHVA